MRTSGLQRGLVSTTCGATLLIVLPAVALLHMAPVLAAGVVGTGTRGSCTEAALDAALAGGGMVTFGCGPHRVTITITSSKTILADTTVHGGSLITISGGNSVGVFSVNTGVAFTVENLTIANGNSVGSDGGGIDNFGTLTVTNSTFSGNRAYSGGGVANSGTLTVTNSIFSGNVARAGGGIANGGTLTVASSTFSGNTAGPSVGGGIWNTDTGLLTVTNSTFSGNDALAGGGIENGGTLTVADSTFSGNSGDFGGGGIDNGGMLTVTNSTWCGHHHEHDHRQQYLGRELLLRIVGY